MPQEIVLSIVPVREPSPIPAEADTVGGTSACGIFQNSTGQTIETGNRKA